MAPLTYALAASSCFNALGALMLRVNKQYWPCSAHSLLCLAEVEGRAVLVFMLAAFELFAAVAQRPGALARVFTAVVAVLGDLYYLGANLLRFHPKLVGFNLYSRFKLTTGPPLSSRSLPPQVQVATLAAVAFEAVVLLALIALEMQRAWLEQKRKSD